MNKNKFSSLVIVVALLAGNALFAQSVDQGKKFYYYKRYKSAREQFEKVLASNPKNEDAIYWLGQTFIDTKDTTAARELFQKALAANPNAPLVVVGTGHVELMDGKTNEARQHFETAISLSRGKDVDVFNAIGKANAQTKGGDARYAIEKLTQATKVKNFNDNLNTYLYTGDAYRQLADGSGAVKAYSTASALSPTLAEGHYKIGMIYRTQNNSESYLSSFEDAVKADPAYAPAYYELFYYWYFRDVNKAGSYLNSYIANADQGPDVEYLKTDFLYASGKFGEARDKALGLISQYGDKVEPRMYKMVAYVCDTLKDINCANKYMTDYFAKQNPADVVSADYEELANINTQTPGSEAQAFVNLQKAVEKDTVVDNKIKYINKAAALAKKMGDRKQEANWLGVAYALKANPTQTDLYNWGMANYQAANYTTADSIFCGLYQTKYPDEIYGYLWCARTIQAADTTMQNDRFAPAQEKLAEMAMKIDSVKFKSQAISAWKALASYYNDVKKDPKTALGYIERILITDPTDAFANTVKPILQKQVNKAAAQPQSSSSKPSSQVMRSSGVKTGATKK